VYGRVILRSRWGGVTIGDGVQLISSSWRCTGGSLNHPVRPRTLAPEAALYWSKAVV